MNDSHRNARLLGLFAGIVTLVAGISLTLMASMHRAHAYDPCARYYDSDGNTNSSHAMITATTTLKKAIDAFNEELVMGKCATKAFIDAGNNWNGDPWAAAVITTINGQRMMAWGTEMLLHFFVIQNADFTLPKIEAALNGLKTADDDLYERVTAIIDPPKPGFIAPGGANAPLPFCSEVDGTGKSGYCTVVDQYATSVKIEDNGMISPSSEYHHAVVDAQIKSGATTLVTMQCGDKDCEHPTFSDAITEYIPAATLKADYGFGVRCAFVEVTGKDRLDARSTAGEKYDSEVFDSYKKCVATANAPFSLRAWTFRAVKPKAATP